MPREPILFYFLKLFFLFTCSRFDTLITCSWSLDRFLCTDLSERCSFVINSLLPSFRLSGNKFKRGFVPSSRLCSQREVYIDAALQIHTLGKLAFSISRRSRRILKFSRQEVWVKSGLFHFIRSIPGCQAIGSNICKLKSALSAKKKVFQKVRAKRYLL